MRFVSSREVRLGLVAALVASLGLAGPAAGQSGRGRGIFRPADPSARVADARQRFDGVVRARTVTMDVAAVMTAARGDSLRLNLFDDLELEIDVTTRRLTHRGSTQWRGRVRGMEDSQVLLAEINGVVAGLIHAPGFENIRIYSAGPGRYQIVQLDDTVAPVCGVGDPDELAARAAPADPARRLGGEIEGCDTGLVIDLMIVYTKEAREAAAGIPNGDPSAILAEIDLAELDFNTILTNSENIPRVNVVHTLELLQPESGSFSTMLDRITSTTDGFYDEVHPVRDAVSADVVCMLVRNNSLGGIAWIMSSPSASFQSRAFNVNYWARAAHSVLAHEVGHNFGCCHDRDNCGGGVLPYSWGHRFTGDDGILYRTTMSYAPGMWIKHFSNPDVLFAGQPTGEPLTDNARTIDETAPIVANFRIAPVPLTPTATVDADVAIEASDGLPDDQFGISVDIAGDVAVVGALNGDGTIVADTGAAYVYRFDGLTWIEEAKLLADDQAFNDDFGASVAISDDGTVIAVGATRDDDNGTDSGAAYVFRHNGVDAWVFEQKLAPDPDDGFNGGAALDNFGASVAVDLDRIIVGSLRDDDTLSNSGSAYIFTYDAMTLMWSQTAKLHADVAGLNDNFGLSVGIDGDLAVVGSWMDDDVGTDAGAALIFRFDGAVWVPEVKLLPPGAEKDAFLFGVSVSIDNSVVVVGARGDDKVSSNVGSAFIYSFDGMNWVQEVKLSSSNDDGQHAPPNTGFGAAVAIGLDEVVVGALLDDVTVDGNEGAAYPYAFVGGQWIASPRVIAVDAMPGDNFGRSVATDGATIIAGAWMRAGGQGAAYLFGANAISSDCDGNGILDACDILEGRQPDCNANGIPDPCDVDPEIALSPDCNANGVPDECDVADGTDTDCNANGVPDECDLDDGILIDMNGDDIADLCQDCNGNMIFDPDEIANDPLLDCNLNGVPDVCDLAEGTSVDADMNGAPDECDDCNMNGTPDFQDIINGAPDINGNNRPDACDPDCNMNGLPDDLDISNGDSIDANDDGVPDECDPDCDGDGESDLIQIVQGIHQDCNFNAIPDVCDIAGGESGDCNEDGIADECQLANATFEDINLDGVPDICQDCNVNGVFDSVEIAINPVLDCNRNLVMDMCESPDINGNGIPDFCEDCNGNVRADYVDLANGTSLDLDHNNVPDECERVGDTNDDGAVDVTDLLAVLANWGFCAAPCPADVNFNGVVDVTDLLIVLGDWG